MFTRRNSAGLVLAFVTVLAAAQPAGDADWRQKAEAAINQARTALADGRNQQALDQLQQAVILIQGQIEKALESFLPDPPQGWSAEKTRTSSMGLTAREGSQSFTQAMRSYTRLEDNIKVRARVTNSSRLAERHRETFKQYKQGKQGSSLFSLEIIEDGQWIGWAMTTGQGQRGSTQLVVLGPGVLVTMLTSGDVDSVKTIWQAFDRRKLAEFNQGQTPAKPE